MPRLLGEQGQHHEPQVAVLEEAADAAMAAATSGPRAVSVGASSGVSAEVVPASPFVSM
jgi:hypothetical protein